MKRNGDNMGLVQKKLSKDFFEKERKNAPKNTIDNDIVPLKLNHEEELIKGKRKIYISLPKK